MTRSRCSVALFAASFAVLSALGCGSGEKPTPVVLPPVPAPVVVPVVPAPEAKVEAKDTDALVAKADAPATPKAEPKPTEKPAETKVETTTPEPTTPAKPEPKTLTPSAPKTLTPATPKTLTPGGKTEPKEGTTAKTGARVAITKCCTALRTMGSNGTIAHRAEYTGAAEACDGMKDMKDANNAFTKLRGILGTNKLPAACQ
jgi:hypothetical protein